MLTCVYRYYEEQLLDDFGYHYANDEHQEYWVQAVFENAGHVRCPVPTRHFADPGADVRLSSTMPLSATNDGMIYHYSNHLVRVRVRVRVSWLGLANPNPNPNPNPNQA